ncbi:MAG TPA: hypothetical protein VF509_08600 [Sphingobium sp.]|jgi:hypothetical protein
MAIIGWIVSTAAFLAGLALRQDLPFLLDDRISNGLLFAAFLTFPPFWAGKPLGITAGQRIMACVAMLLTLPVLFLPS